jgi:hypothetical protein
MKKAYTKLEQLSAAIVDAEQRLSEVTAELQYAELIMADVKAKATYDEEIIIQKRIDALENDYNSLIHKHNNLCELVAELNMESHTHWWK